MELLIISGLSGAGKSRAADMLEDLDYYCVDNMPVALLPRFAELCLAAGGRYERVALVTDIREKAGFDELFQALETLKELGCPYRILFLEATVPTIVRRYKETRRRHPLLTAGGDTIENAVTREIELMSGIRARADHIIDTTSLTLGMLQGTIYSTFIGRREDRQISVTVISFGFKYGIPLEADLVFDVRFLPNPFYVKELRELGGLDEDVKEFLNQYEDTKELLGHLTRLIDFLMPRYVDEGKYALTVAVGCTGGRHRSVAIAEALSEHIHAGGGVSRTIHRDIHKG